MLMSQTLTVVAIIYQIHSATFIIGQITNVTTGGANSLVEAQMPIQLAAAQRTLNAMCASKCRTEICYIADQTDCRNFITCQTDGKGSYHATLQPCAFGTYWAGLQKQKKITCDLAENVVCLINYCEGKQVGAKYNHNDGNCKTYWSCGPKGPMAKCCPDGYRYDNTINDCVADTAGVCQHACPIKQDACLSQSVTTEYFDDGNCRTYWDCENRQPHPVCCPDGEGYDPVKGMCAKNGCKDLCPPEYKPDACLKGVTKYELIDGSCRTYMKCNAVDGDERWCCPSDYIFDAKTQDCVERTPEMNMSCNDYCPLGYNEVCHLKASPKPDEYIQRIHGVDIPMPCAPGSTFDVTKCACAVPVRNAPDNSCTMELDIKFDKQMVREGSQSQIVINSIGMIGEGPSFNGTSTYKFDGDLIFKVPFYQQEMPKLYTNIIYLPDKDVATGKQVLLSNCINTELGQPSLELSLQNSQIRLSLVTDQILENATRSVSDSTPVVAAVSYTPGMWNRFIAVYDGMELSVLNEAQGPPAVDRKSLAGTITVPGEGLAFGGCAINRGLNEGFRGSMAQLQFSKCLKQKWIDDFNSRAKSPTVIQPGL